MIHNLIYIDPGSGSYLVQIIVAGALGVAYFFRNIKNYIRALFTRPEKNKQDKPEE